MTVLRKTAYLLYLPVALLAACSDPRPDPKICLPAASVATSVSERDKALEKPLEARAAQVVLGRYARGPPWPPAGSRSGSSTA